MKRYLHENRDVTKDENFWRAQVSSKIGKGIKKLKLSNPITDTKSESRKAISRFTNKEARFHDGQLDSTNIKVVLTPFF